VTKGLDPDAPMKDSGVEWLGEIPHHWDIAVLKYMASMKSGDFIAIEDIHSDGRYPVYGGNGLRGYTEEYNCDGYFPLIGRQGALCGNINFGAGKFWATEHAIVVRPLDGIDPDWLGHILSIMNLNQYSMSSAQPGLSVGQISNLKTARLNSDDQIQISNYCKNETAKIDALVAKVERAVELLKERRVALISAAVTGKIDLREETT
jgi:type I restriction enzyme S subunit